MVTSDSFRLVYEDARLNSWRWRPLIDKWGYWPLFINPGHLKTTAFLIEGGVPASTCFFIRASLNSADNISHHSLFGAAYYAVTAWHCIADVDVSIRFGLKGGGFEDKPILSSDWIPHGKTDLALLPISFPVDGYDVTWIHAREVVEDGGYLHTVKPGEGGRYIKALRYGVGDEVFSIGLFTGPRGELANGAATQPVARFGHIAMKPEPGEKILAKVGDLGNVELDAFLVEIAAWKGQSGSPVFLRPFTLDNSNAARVGREINFVVGVVQGFYLAEEQVEVGEDKANLPYNMGLAVVVPSSYILELLMREDVVADRQRKYKEHQEENSLQPESASRPTADPAPGVITHESFEEALRRASRRVTTPEPEQAEE